MYDIRGVMVWTLDLWKAFGPVTETEHFDEVVVDLAFPHMCVWLRYFRRPQNKTTVHVAVASYFKYLQLLD